MAPGKVLSVAEEKDKGSLGIIPKSAYYWASY